MPTIHYYARTNKSAKNYARRFGHVPTKAKALKNIKKWHGCNLYVVTYHDKNKRRR